MAPFAPKPDHELDRLDDERLIAYVRAARDAGDRDAAARGLAYLVYGHWPNLARRVAMKVPTAHVEDVTEDVVLSAIRSAFDGTSVGELRAWLATITKRAIADFHRRGARSPATVPIASDPEQPGAAEPAAPSEDRRVADIEEEASQFAAELLMPRWLFVREHARVGGDLDALCAAFGSSQAAMQRRLRTVYGTPA